MSKKYYLYHIPHKSYSGTQWDYAKTLAGSLGRKELIGIHSIGDTSSIFTFVMPISEFMSNIDQFHAVVDEGGETMLVSGFINNVIAEIDIVIYDKEYKY